MPVNHITREQLLAALRSQGAKDQEGWTSGEALASGIGLSRVAVWKAAQALKEAGYPIESSKKGYRLRETKSFDALSPWEFPGHTEHIHLWQHTTSTMDRARELALKGEGDGTIAIAETQEAGRGRQGRSWQSNNGGLFFTLIRRPKLAAQAYLRAVFATQLACARAIERFIDRPVALSWPNDLLVEGRKIGGVLAEFWARGDYIDWIGLGVGINVLNREEGAASLSEWSTASSRREVLAAILEEFKQGETADFTHPDLLRAWEARLVEKGKRVALSTPFHRGSKSPNDTEELTLLGVDSLGRCRVKGREGIREYGPAECSLVPLSPH